MATISRFVVGTRSVVAVVDGGFGLIEPTSILVELVHRFFGFWSDWIEATKRLTGSDSLEATRWPRLRPRKADRGAVLLPFVFWTPWSGCEGKERGQIDREFVKYAVEDCGKRESRELKVGPRRTDEKQAGRRSVRRRRGGMRTLGKGEE